MAELVDAARGLYLDRSYTEVTIAEVAAAGSVSRGLVNRYFGGRSGMFVAVVEAVANELHQRLSQAARAPFSRAKRMEDLLATFFSFFSGTPGAYRLLVQDVWVVQEPAIVAAVEASRALLAGDIAQIVGGDGRSPEEVALVCSGILGAAFANVGLILGGTEDLEPELAWRVTCELAVSQLRPP